MKAIAAVVAMLLLAAPGAARAEGAGGQCDCSHTHWHQHFKPTWYAGGSLNKTNVGDWSLLEVVSSDPSFTSHTSDNSDSGARVFGGMGFLTYFALEAAYADLGEVSARAQNDGSGGFWAAGPVTETAALSALELTLIGRLPLFKDAALFGLAGAFRWTYDARITGSDQFVGPFSFSEEGSSTSFAYGAGLEYDGLLPLRVVAAYTTTSFRNPLVPSRDIELGRFAISLAYLF